MDSLIFMLPIPPPLPELLWEDGLHNRSRLPLCRNPDYFQTLTDKAITETYRLDRHQIEYLQELLHDELSPVRWRYGVLTPLEIILKALMFLAAGTPLHVSFFI